MYIHTYTSIIILQVGPMYGRKTMTGLLASQGLRVSQVRVGESLRHTNPQYHHQRKNSTTWHLNPVPYSAEYFGHKVHIDHNEKLIMYGVTHVCARDGYSGKVVDHKHRNLWASLQVCITYRNAHLTGNHVNHCSSYSHCLSSRHDRSITAGRWLWTVGSNTCPGNFSAIQN